MSKRKKKKTARKKELRFDILLKISDAARSNPDDIFREFEQYLKKLLKTEGGN